MQSSSPHLRLFRHLVRPARGGAAGVVIVFALLLVVSAQAGLMGIPLALLLTLGSSNTPTSCLIIRRVGTMNRPY